jgi:hypothetical protein
MPESDTDFFNTHAIYHSLIVFASTMVGACSEKTGIGG